MSEDKSAQDKQTEFAEASRVLKKSNFTRFLGLEVEELKDGYCRTRLVVRPDFLNQGGVVHGGLYGVVADHTAGTAASTIAPDGMRVVTSEYKINLMRPGDCDALVTEGAVIKGGKRLIIGEAKVYGEKDGNRELLAVSLFTFAVIAK